MPVTATGVGAEVDTTGKALELTQGTGLGDYTAASTGALLGTTLAEKNGLAVGSTFTVKDQSFTVAGLFDAGTAFGNNALYLTLPTPQTLAELPGELSTMIVTVNSLENVDTAKTALQAAGARDLPAECPAADNARREPPGRGQPAADLRHRERLPRRHRRGHRRRVWRRHRRGAGAGPAHRPHPSHRSPPMRVAMIEVKNLVRTFKSGDRTIKPVNDVSFLLEQGTLASIVGKSGSGKSTLLSLLGALDKPTSGDVLVNGVSLAGMPDGKLTGYRRRDIGFVFQQFNLIPNLSAVDNVMLPMEFAGIRKAARLERARALLEQVQLDPDKHGRRINRLSGGEQQRVAIARALANSPKLILADEPTGNLDEQTGEHIIELLSSLSRDHDTTILVVTHDRSLANKTDRRIRLQQGRLTEEAAHSRIPAGASG